MGGCLSKRSFEDLDANAKNEFISRNFAITGGQTSKAPEVPKSGTSAVEEDFPFLMKSLSKLLLFANLSDAKKVALCSKMYHVDVAAGEILIREGDSGLAASELYVVKSGEFEVLQKHKEVNVRVNRKQAGDIFGEVALLYSVPRNATVVALSDSSVFVLPRDVFNYHMRESSRSAKVQVDIFLNSVHVIQPLNKQERSELLEALEEEYVACPFYSLCLSLRSEEDQKIVERRDQMTGKSRR